MIASRAAGLLLGVAADRLFGDPVRWHPVAGFGCVATALERRLWSVNRFRGTVHTGLLVTAAAATGWLAERSTRHRPGWHLAATAAGTWIVLGGESLRREAIAVADLLDGDDLPGARRRVGGLVGRDTSALDIGGVSRAAVESVAENTSDAVVAPLVIGAVSGVGGLFFYRAANTLDAMVGHRTERYEQFGWAAARLDDLVNLPGARLAALLAVVAAPGVAGHRTTAWRICRRDARRHPSPNAGVVEAAFAGALGVRLGGRNCYPGGVEDRPELGDGPVPGPEDIRRAARLAGVVNPGAGVVAAVLALLRPRRVTG